MGMERREKFALFLAKKRLMNEWINIKRGVYIWNGYGFYGAATAGRRRLGRFD